MVESHDGIVYICDKHYNPKVIEFTSAPFPGMCKCLYCANSATHMAPASSYPLDTQPQKA